MSVTLRADTEILLKLFCVSSLLKLCIHLFKCLLIKIEDNTYTLFEMRGVINVIIPNTLTYLGTNAFNGCTTLKSIVIPEGVNVLNRYMFSGCKALERVEIKSQASSVPVGMFMNCESLRELTFAGKVTSVTTDSFRGCKSLTEFPSENLTSLGIFAFAFCESLTDIYCGAESKPANWENTWAANCEATVHLPDGSKRIQTSGTMIYTTEV